MLIIHCNHRQEQKVLHRTLARVDHLVRGTNKNSYNLYIFAAVRPLHLIDNDEERNWFLDNFGAKSLAWRRQRVLSEIHTRQLRRAN
jgi:hypothetical protein